MYFRRPGLTVVMDVMYLQPIYRKISHKYCIVALDGFSRYASVILLKNLRAENVVPKVDEFLRDNIFRYEKVFTDSGVEFVSKKMRELYKKYEISWYTNPSPHKTSICERFIQTLKRKMVRYISHFNREDVTSVIHKLVMRYNSKDHAGLMNEQ